MSIRNKIAAAAFATVIALSGTATASAQFSSSSVVDSVKPVEDANGTQYQVSPTLSGGRVGSSALSSDPSDELEENGVPATRSILDQLICHMFFAPTKPTWNLEDYREDVGFTQTVSSMCNP